VLVSVLFCDSMVIIMVFAAHIIVAKAHSNSECEPSQMCTCSFCLLKKKLNANNTHVHCLNKLYTAINNSDMASI
jgi:hypothetical protein